MTLTHAPFVGVVEDPWVDRTAAAVAVPIAKAPVIVVDPVVMVSGGLHVT